MSTTPPGILTGSPPRFPNGIAVPGIAHLEITAGPMDHEWITTDAAGQHHDGSLVLGETLAHGAIVLNYATVAAWRALALYAGRVADWKEAGA